MPLNILNDTKISSCNQALTTIKQPFGGSWSICSLSHHSSYFIPSLLLSLIPHLTLSSSPSDDHVSFFKWKWKLLDIGSHNSN